MSQLAGGGGQPGDREELFYFLHQLEAERSQEQGWQEPYESRDSRTDLRGTGGEIPPVYPTNTTRIATIDSGFQSISQPSLIPFTPTL